METTIYSRRKLMAVEKSNALKKRNTKKSARTAGTVTDGEKEKISETEKEINNERENEK